MFYIFILNLFLCFLIEFYKYFFVQKYFKFEFISPVSISFIFNFPVFVLINFIGPVLYNINIENKYYQFSILMINISNICSILILLFFTKSSNKILLKTNNITNIFNFPIRNNFYKRTNYIVFLFGLLYIFSFSMLASHSIGIIDWVKSPRSGYQVGREGAGQWFAFSITFLSVVSFFTLISFNGKKLFISIIILAYLWYLTGSKGFLLRFFEFILIIFCARFTQKKINIFAPLIILISTIPILLLFFGTNFQINNIYDQLDEVGLYFDHINNSVMYYEAYFNNNLPLFLGEIKTSSLWSYVPRSFYPNKPYSYGPTLINEYFYPGSAEQTNTPAFGGMVNEFADFGFFGLLYYSIFNFAYYLQIIIISKFYFLVKYKNILSKNNKLGLIMFFIAPSFLFFFAFPINLLFFFFIYFIIYFIFNINFKKNSEIY